MRKIHNYIKTNNHCLLLLYWPLHFICYEIFRVAFADADVLMIHSNLDDKIPFCEWFIIPYVLWYFYIAAISVYSLMQGKREFLRTELTVILSMAVPMIFCAIVPNGIEYSMRPDFSSLGRENWAIELVKAIYEADSLPRNVMPSMHVSVSWGMMLSLWASKSLKNNWFIKIAGSILSILITMSTVFIKQHSILDVFAGIAVALAVFAAVLFFEKRYDKKRASAHIHRDI